VTPQTVNGVTYAFSNWAHGGAPTQTVTAANGNTSYTINYSSPLTGRWRTTDVGRVGAYGNATFNNGTFTLSGSGNDIWGSADAFRFVYQSITGDVDIRARVTGLTYTHPWAKAGVMIRNSTDRSAKHAMTVVMAGNGSSFQRRTEAGGLSTAAHGSGATPYWVRMVRNGNTFTSYVSPDGQSWSMVGTPMTIAMNSRVYVGLVLTSHSSSTLATATITDVSVTTPAVAASAARAVVPENQYEVFDVYPNPVSGNTLNVKFHDQARGRKLQVISLLGQVLYEQALLDDDASNNISVDVGSLPPGVYSIRASDKLKTQTRSFIRH
jgi:regulation of enolase protein 1 (concanavalin A-like superfamily)